MEEEQEIGFEETADNFTQYLFSLAHQRPYSELSNRTYLEDEKRYLRDAQARRKPSDQQVVEDLGKGLLHQQEIVFISPSAQKLAAQLILAVGLTYEQTVGIFESHLAQAESLPLKAREVLGISDRGFDVLQNHAASKVNDYTNAIGRRHVFPIPAAE